jgi:membrane protein
MNAFSLSPGAIFGLLKKTAANWMEDNALRLSAALSYYSIFSIAPLLVIALGIAGFFLSDEAKNGLLSSQLTQYVGPKAAENMQEMVQATNKPSSGIGATIIGFVTLLFGASGVFGQLKDALNTVWEVKLKAGLGVWGFIRERVLSFGMVLVIGFLMLTSLLLTSLFTSFYKMVGNVVPIHPAILGICGFLLSFAVVVLLFAMIFKVLPDAEIEWKHVWIGAIVTGILFEIGKFGLSWYLGRESTSSSYGAAGSVILLLLWVYYASCILLFGAEFTQVYAEATGHKIQPSKLAEPMHPHDRAADGNAGSKTGGASASDVPAPPKETVAHLASAPIFYRRKREETPFPKTIAEVPGYLRHKPVASLGAALVGGFLVGLISRLVERKAVQQTPVEKISSGTRALAVAAVPLVAGLGRRFAAKAARAMSAKAFQQATKWVQKKVLPVAVFVLLTGASAAAERSAAKGSADKGPRDAAQIEEATRLQVFLDRANFGPGKIDGRGGEFTRKALARYRAAQGLAAGSEAGPSRKSSDADLPDTAGLDLASFGEVFTTYTVTADEVKTVAEIPESPAEQAKLTWLGYRTVGEGIAEKFHCDIDFLKELNPEASLDTLKEGDQLKVPNVEPFELAGVKDLKPGAEAASPANDQADAGEASGEAATEDAKSGAAAGAKFTVHISTKENMLEVRDGEKVRAAFPITAGSNETASPVGDWKIKGVAKLPTFRYDKKMLKEGERSSDFHMLPAGPNSPVGVMWIALNKKGIGLHGTDDPDTIGRAASHGCIRLANWDIVKLAALVKGGVAVTIE